MDNTEFLKSRFHGVPADPIKQRFESSTHFGANDFSVCCERATEFSFECSHHSPKSIFITNDADSGLPIHSPRHDRANVVICDILNHRG